MSAARKGSEEPTVLATNRKALRDYTILETFEAGIQLKGTEIKSIRQRQVSLEGSFARIDEGELFLYNMHVSPYEQGGRENVEPTRRRKLLMHRREIIRLVTMLRRQRATLIPLRLYLKRHLAKVALALGKGKRVYEKRTAKREQDVKRNLQRLVRQRQRRS